MKIIRSPNLLPGEEGIMVQLTRPRNFARGGLVREADRVRGAGRYGDTMLVHINPEEFAQLKRAWGEPHYNPDTELPEFFDWMGAIKTVAPYVLGAFGKKASIDAANQNPAPPADPNMTTHLGTGVNTRTQVDPGVKDYYTYGQGPEKSFFKNNSLGAVKYTPGAQVQPKLQSSPSTGQALLGGLTGGALQWALQNPDKVVGGIKKLFGQNPATTGGGWQGPSAESLGQSQPGFTMPGMVPAAAAGAGVGAIPALGADAAKAGLITVEEMPGSMSIPGAEGALAQAAGAGGMPTGMGGGAGAGMWGATGATPEAGSGLLPGSTLGSSMADSGAAITSDLPMTATTPGMGATLGGLGMGLGAMGAWYLGSRMLANQGHMNPQDWKKHMAGSYATANDAYTKAAASGDINAKAHAWQQMQQAAQGYASRLMATKDPNDAALAKQIYGQFGQVLPTWYTAYLKAHNGGTGGGKAFAEGGLAMAGAGGLGQTMPGVSYMQGQSLGAPMHWSYNGQSGIVGGSGPQPPMQGSPDAPQPNLGWGNENALNVTPEQQAQQQAWRTNFDQFRAQNPNAGLSGMMNYIKQNPQYGGGGVGSPGGFQKPPPGPSPWLPNGQPNPAGSLFDRSAGGTGMGAMLQSQPPPASTTGPMMGGMTPSGPGAQAQLPNAPRTGLGMNPAWSPMGSPQQNAMPRPAGIGPPQMIPPPSAQSTMPMRQAQMGGFGRARMGMGLPRAFEQGGQVSGPGTGTSDQIPARLSDGEYIIPAHVVAALGDGSTNAGAKKLDELQRQVRIRTGKQMARNRHPKPAKPPIEFINDLLAAQDTERSMRGE